MIEVVVVFAILGLLLAIGYATLIRAERNTSVTRFQNEIRQVGLSLAGFEHTRGYYPTDATTLASIEPGVQFAIGGPATDERLVSIQPGTSAAGNAVLGIAKLTDAGECLLFVQPPVDAENEPYRSGLLPPGSTTPCSGAQALLISGQAW
jgi:type II secretory pathway pseudopilin PulG